MKLGTLKTHSQKVLNLCLRLIGLHAESSQTLLCLVSRKFTGQSFLGSCPGDLGASESFQMKVVLCRDVSKLRECTQTYSSLFQVVFLKTGSFIGTKFLFLYSKLSI